MNRKLLESEFFPFVTRPARYIGNELGAVHKEGSNLVRMALAFPDKYELGMSNLAIQIIYNLVNDLDFAVCERVFTPDLDAAALMRKQGIPLFSLESFTPIAEFDLVGFSLSYELNFTNMLAMLDLAGIPFRSEERGEEHPLICAGGPACFNPEPIADFLDFFYVGEVEETIGELLTVAGRKGERNRAERLKALSRIEGVYVPSYYRPLYSEDQRFRGLEKLQEGVPDRIKAGMTGEIAPDYYPTQPIVPFEEVTHDRLTVEIMRGCGHACRFCQAGIIYRPKRDRKATEIVDLAVTNLKNTGYDELTLLSLSASDYQEMDQLITLLLDRLGDRHIKISLPSLRPTMKSLELARRISPHDRPALTFALEGGSERMRQVINKNISIEEFYHVVQSAFAAGWRLIKLYFMIGLPSETDDDLKGIVEVIRNCEQICRRHRGRANINVTISPFSPKALTPWQWERQDSIEKIARKNAFLKRSCRSRHVQLKIRSGEVNYLEGVCSRGDRRLSAVIEKAYELGARFDGWSEHFNFGIWQQAFAECGIRMEDYTRERSINEALPWDHIDKGISTDWLRRERERSHHVDELESDKDGDFKFADIIIAPCEVAEQVLDVLPASRGKFGRKPKRKVTGIDVAVPRSRLRICWSKDERVRFLAHLATARMFERALRRAEIPVAYSQGYHPRPRISLGPPLSLGYTSKAEYLDIQLQKPFYDNMIERLNRKLPSGFRVTNAMPIMGKATSLSGLINLACYEVQLPERKRITPAIIEDTLARAEILITRRRGEKVKQVEVRKAILNIELREGEPDDILYLELGLGNLGFVRPDDLMINCFGYRQEEILPLNICRTDLLVWESGKRMTPFEVN
ncbi:MAG: TIGR03960 family B12-binding radical SAM protein [candidate division Zixibacteria bacterium]|nr:TIGR03960 family B12-binding radical SAM protein [candidate division Zixibacteria bacterium]